MGASAAGHADEVHRFASGASFSGNVLHKFLPFALIQKLRS